MRSAFVVEHRPLFSVRAMCRCLRIHPSGFYAWLKHPVSKRAREDERQTKLIETA
jgi:putative transposase